MAVPAAPSQADWDRLRREARRLEAELEEKVQLYGDVARERGRRQNGGAAAYDRDPDPERGDSKEFRLEEDLDRLLIQLGDVNDGMERCISSGVAGGASRAVLQRYREVQFDFKTEFKKASAEIRRCQEADELFRNRAGRRGHEGDSETEHLMREQGHISRSMNAAGGIVGQAQAARESLRQQRLQITGAQSLLNSMTEAFPGIGRVVESIRRRRIKENMIVGTVIALCICFIIWYLFL